MLKDGDLGYLKSIICEYKDQQVRLNLEPDRVSLRVWNPHTQSWWETVLIQAAPDDPGLARDARRDTLRTICERFEKDLPDIAKGATVTEMVDTLISRYLAARKELEALDVLAIQELLHYRATSTAHAAKRGLEEIAGYVERLRKELIDGTKTQDEAPRA